MVAYYRVSTKKQGDSGLGIDAQKAAVAGHVSGAGCELVASYVEVESGKNDARPELAKAISHAKRAKATLVIAKLDRLARDVHFVSGLMKAGVAFTACDNPTANNLTIHILAAVAEDEARRISERTKAALRAAKVRGTVLGATIAANRTREGTLKGVAAARIAKATQRLEAYVDLGPMIVELATQDLSLQKIADAMNERGEVTRRGRRWNAMQVSRVLAAAKNTTIAFDQIMTPAPDAATRQARMESYVAATNERDDATARIA